MSRGKGECIKGNPFPLSESYLEHSVNKLLGFANSTLASRINSTYKAAIGFAHGHA